MNTPPTPVSSTSFNVYFRLDRIINEYTSMTTDPHVVTILRELPADDRAFQQAISHDHRRLQGRSPDLEDHEINIFEAAFLTLMKDVATHSGALAIYVEEILGIRPVPDNQKLQALQNAVHVRTLFLNSVNSSRGHSSTPYQDYFLRSSIPSAQEASIGLQIFNSIHHPRAQITGRKENRPHQTHGLLGFDGSTDAALEGAMDDPRLTELLAVYREAKSHFRETEQNTEAYLTMARILCGKAKECIQHMQKVKPGDARLVELRDTLQRTSGGGNCEAQGIKRPRDYD
ncbi:MAG: hypothetical protein Q9171_002522 [Xanthocarpia ochracea]